MTYYRWMEAMQRLREQRHVGVDVETSGLDWKRNHIVGWVLTFGPNTDDSYYLPVRHAGGGNIDYEPGPQTAEGWDGTRHSIEEELVSLLDRKGMQLLFHNAAFDLRFMYRVGYRFRAYHEDTMLNATLLDENQGKFSLEHCARLAGVQSKKATEMHEYLITQFPDDKLTDRSAMSAFWKLRGDDEMAVSYAEGDGTTTWQLRHYQRPLLAEEGLTTVHDIECRLIPVLARMSCHGIRVDEKRLYDLKSSIEDNIAKLLAEFPEGFNPRSPVCVRGWCEQNGQNDWPLTPKGKPSFPEKWLETHDAGRKIVEIRKLATLLASFVNPMIETHMFQGRVHGNFNQLRSDNFGTVTGRLSASDPNLQQVPKHNEKIGRMFRRIFVPDEGKIWASVDYSQCEPRLLAYYARCKVLIDGYNAKPSVDAHTAVANASGLDRQTGKRVNQTLLTGGGKKALVDSYGVQNVDKVWEDYFNAMPEIRILQKRAALKFRQSGFVKSLLGRRARFTDKDYVAVNRLLQCGNADIIKYKMVQIDDYLESVGRPLEMLNNVHDAIDFQFDEQARPHYEECLRIMVDFGPDQLIHIDVVPFEVDAHEGQDWAEATYGPEKSELMEAAE